MALIETIRLTKEINEVIKKWGWPRVFIHTRDTKIDQMVYEQHELTPEEIAVVEESQ